MAATIKPRPSIRSNSGTNPPNETSSSSSPNRYKCVSHNTAGDSYSHQSTSRSRNTSRRRHENCSIVHHCCRPWRRCIRPSRRGGPSSSSELDRREKPFRRGSFARHRLEKVGRPRSASPCLLLRHIGVRVEGLTGHRGGRASILGRC